MKLKLTLPRSFEGTLKASTQRALHALASVARDRVTTMAQAKLKGSAQMYVKALSAPQVQGSSLVMVLAGTLPNMLEQGAGPFDIKKMLHGRRYVDVPFRHAAPGSKGVKAIPKADANVMLAAVRSAKSALARGPRTMPTAPASNKTSGYQHLDSKYSSMLRVAHTYKGASQAQYLTFRRISANSDPGSWVHPGFKALGIFPAVMKELRKLAPKLLADYVREGLR